MPPKASIAHDSAGRLRLRVPSRQSDTAWFEDLKTAVGAIEGVIAVEANPLTAGVLVLHERDTDAILREALGRGLFEVSGPEPPRPLLADSLAQRAADLDGQVRTATRGRLDLKSAAVAGLLGISAVQVLRGSILPPAAVVAAWAAGLIFTGPERRSNHPL